MNGTEKYINLSLAGEESRRTAESASRRIFQMAEDGVEDSSMEHGKGRGRHRTEPARCFCKTFLSYFKTINWMETVQLSELKTEEKTKEQVGIELRGREFERTCSVLRQTIVPFALGAKITQWGKGTLV